MITNRYLSLLAVGLLISAEAALAGDALPLADARSSALADIYAPINSLLNPASMSLTPERAIGCVWQNRYLMKELSTFSASYQQPFALADLSVQAGRYGYSEYAENYVGTSVSKLLITGLSVGVRLFYTYVQYTGNVYNNSLFGCDIGLQYTPVDNFTVGMFIGNPIHFGSGSGEALNLPIRMALGISYEVINNCSLLAEIEQRSGMPVRFKGAVCYDAERLLTLRVGLATAPLTPTAGVALRFAPFTVDVALQYHNTLGASPTVGITYSF